MHQPIKQSLHEARGILADVSTSQTHPSSAEKPGLDVPRIKHIMHAMNVALLKSGELANKSYERKSPKWPVKGESISVLGYGAEKVVYRVSDSDSARDNVVSVYHIESLRNSPETVLKGKRERYETYKKYFGNMVLPTAFVILDNPWGDGAKPASIQTYIEDTERFSDLGEQEVRQRAKSDPNFAAQLEQLTKGYTEMMSDGYRPDFASSNLLVSGSNIVIFDTGAIYKADDLSQIIHLSPNYQTLESLASR